MLPEYTIRAFSSDSAVFDEVFFNNKYKLKGHKENGRTIVDIGSHAGYFSFLALSLGAKKVYSFEPYIDNFNLLLKNCYIPNFLGRFTPYNLGINTEPSIGRFDAPKFIDNIYFDFSSIGFSLDNSEKIYPCRCEKLDDLLTNQCFGEKIDVLKINLGYAEREILLGSSLLASNVISVCGEITANDAQLLDFKQQLGIKGFVNFVSETPTENDRVIFRASQVNLSDNFI